MKPKKTKQHSARHIKGGKSSTANPPANSPLEARAAALTRRVQELEQELEATKADKDSEAQQRADAHWRVQDVEAQLQAAARPSSLLVPIPVRACAVSPADDT